MAKKHWQKIWKDHAITLCQDKERLKQETTSLRWRLMSEIIKTKLGPIEGLDVVEIGAGLGDFSIIFNQRGANTTLADYSEEAIRKAKERFNSHGLKTNYLQADVLKDKQLSALDNKFDISFSLGLAEHFTGSDRRKIITSHAKVLKRGGLTFISVPYKYSPSYQLWKKRMIKNNQWSYGVEIPFSKKEIKRLAEESGLSTVSFIQSSFFTDWNNFFPRHKIGKIFKNKLNKKSLFNNFAYALVYVGEKK